MKKLFVFFLLISTVLVFSYCSSSKKAAAGEAAKSAIVYTATNLETVILNNCAPCHFPAKGGKVKALDSYAAVRDNIDEILNRIQLNPTDKGFMPFKKTEKLSDATVSLFKQWKADGMIEK